MILPNKTVKPVDSLFCIAAYVLDALKDKALPVDDLHQQLIAEYPKNISIETLLLCLDYLYIIGKLESHDEIVKIKF